MWKAVSFLRFKLSEYFLHRTVNLGTVLCMTKSEVHNSRNVPSWITKVMALSFMNHNVYRMAFFDQ